MTEFILIITKNNRGKSCCVANNRAGSSFQFKIKPIHQDMNIEKVWVQAIFFSRNIYITEHTEPMPPLAESAWEHGFCRLTPDGGHIFLQSYRRSHVDNNQHFVLIVYSSSVVVNRTNCVYLYMLYHMCVFTRWLVYSAHILVDTIYTTSLGLPVSSPMIHVFCWTGQHTSRALSIYI